MLIIVSDLDKFFRTKKEMVIFFPKNFILNQKHNTNLSIINEKRMFQTEIYMGNILSTQIHYFIQTHKFNISATPYESFILFNKE